MSRLADMLDVSLSAATGLVDRIEERGFVERIRVPSDRRIVLVRITDAGRQMLDDIELGARPRSSSRILDGLDEAQLTPTSPRRWRISGPPSTTIARPTTRPGRYHSTPRPKGGSRRLMEAFPAAQGEEYIPSLEEDPALGLSHRAKMEILFAVMLGLFLGALDQTIVGPALPTIVTQLSRQRLLRLGHHDLPADQHDQRPVLGQAVRHLRPQADLHDRHRDLPDRLGAVRPQPEHGDAHPVPRHPGHRRRFAVPGRARDHR